MGIYVSPQHLYISMAFLYLPRYIYISPSEFIYIPRYLYISLDMYISPSPAGGVQVKNGIAHLHNLLGIYISHWVLIYSSWY